MRRAIAMIAAIATIAIGCTGAGARDPSAVGAVEADAARAGLHLAATGLARALDVCNARARAIAAPGGIPALAAGKRLADDCLEAGRAGLAALEDGEAILDVHDAIVDGRVGCAAQRGLAELRRVRELLARHDAPVPPIVDQAMRQAMRLAPLAGGACAPSPAAPSRSAP